MKDKVNFFQVIFSTKSSTFAWWCCEMSTWKLFGSLGAIFKIAMWTAWVGGCVSDLISSRFQGLPNTMQSVDLCSIRKRRVCLGWNFYFYTQLSHEPSKIKNIFIFWNSNFSVVLRMWCNIWHRLTCLTINSQMLAPFGRL